ncbi:MAG: fdm 4 [Moraxellaceae bacterium]|jgi:threonine dehydrogenase-like Zn-dependent dehydrogenase|nr:fdm 4 [Moraxellaceae bacterium]
MKALCWFGKEDVRIENVPDPRIEKPDDILIRVTSTAICGSDLHLYDGVMPTMEKGDILGHEPMGEVVEAGPHVTGLRTGDRVVIPFQLSCGACWFCQRQLFSLCDTSNPEPNATMARKVMGHSPAALFGYSHMLGGFSGGQAEYMRVPYANTGPIRVPEGMPDEKALFLSDILPTGYMAAENANIEPGDTVAVWGCGPVGLFCMQSAWLLGAGRVIAMDWVKDRLALAEKHCRAETVNIDRQDVYDTLMKMTQGRGPDSCIDAVGAEAHGWGSIDAVVDRVKMALHLATDRPHVLREMIKCCRKGGTLSIPGVYIGYVDKLPFGPLMNKGLTVKTGQTHVRRYTYKLLQHIENGDIDPTFVISHRLRLDEGPEAYKTFRDKKDHCVKVVLRP